MTFRRRPQATQSEHRASDPLIGYLNYSDIDQCRRNKAAESDLSDLIIPKDWTRDPYLLCVLLSVGQLQRRLLYPVQKDNYTSRLLVANASDSEFIYIYEAQVPSGALRILDHPTTAMSVRWPTIQRRRIPFKPFETFKQRLEDVLLEPNCRNCDSLKADVYGEAVATGSLKRKRDV